MGIVLLNRFVGIKTKLTMILMKDVLLILYSNAKIVFRKIKLIFGLKNLL